MKKENYCSSLSLSLKKAAPAEAQELYDAYKEAAKRRYKTYIRKTQEGWARINPSAQGISTGCHRQVATHR